MSRNFVGYLMLVLVIGGCAGRGVERVDKPMYLRAMEFVYIEPGEFIMGSPLDEIGRDSDEDQHNEIIESGFYLQTTEVTQFQWQAVMGSSPAFFKDCGGSCPVEYVGWGRVQAFIQQLNEIDQDHTYRLPTEKEWEYACRAGQQEAFSFGGASEQLDSYAWHSGNSGGQTHPVGQKMPNKWGLYDMHGNVWEWTQTCSWYFRPGTLVPSTTNNPSGCASRIVRGGGWLNEPQALRSAQRYELRGSKQNFGLGFRLVREP